MGEATRRGGRHVGAKGEQHERGFFAAVIWAQESKIRMARTRATARATAQKGKDGLPCRRVFSVAALLKKPASSAAFAGAKAKPAFAGAKRLIKIRKPEVGKAIKL